MKLVQRAKKKYDRGKQILVKLAQKTGLAYYKYKFRLLGLFSPRKAAEAAFELLCTPYTKRKVHAMPAVFKEAQTLSFTIDRYTINGFKWNCIGDSNGKKVLICHGFDSHSYRFETFVTIFRSKGYEVLAFDAPAHGTSTGKTVNASQYRDMILKANQLFGPFDRIMAHSFGGIAVALAVEKLEDNEDKRLVLIAPATETTTMVNTFFNYIPVTQKVRYEFDRLIEEIGGNSIEWFSVSRIMEQITTPTLWVHDKDDTITPYADMQHLINKGLPHVEFEITEGLGHSDIYKEERIIKKIVAFLSEQENVLVKV